MRENIKAIAIKIFGERGARKLKKLYFHNTIKSLQLIHNFAKRAESRLTWQYKVTKHISKYGTLKLHLGCGDQYYPDMLNCEYRATKAADLVMDCGNLSMFKDKNVSLIFSHAFFEHLYKKQQIPLLEDCYRVLKDEGVLIFLGIPDFQVIAEAYLRKASGIKRLGDTFDLYHVYRYTHGDPELALTWWTQQLHKSLFDKSYIELLLKEVGFNNPIIFNYCYPGENIPLNLGFIAGKKKINKDIKSILTPFSEYFANLDEIILEKIL